MDHIAVIKNLIIILYLPKAIQKYIQSIQEYIHSGA
jgi:hypothetical protein